MENDDDDDGMEEEKRKKKRETKGQGFPKGIRPDYLTRGGSKKGKLTTTQDGFLGTLEQVLRVSDRLGMVDLDSLTNQSSRLCHLDHVI